MSKKEETAALTEEQLRKMIRDPRYWRDRDQEFVVKVREGFIRLYRKNKDV